jgi:hypothetical protein
MYVVPPANASGELDRLRALVAQHFPVYEARVGRASVIFLVQVNPTTLEGAFDALRKDLWAQGYVGQIRLQEGEYLLEISRRPPNRPWQGYVNLGLLALTLVTTLFAGAFLWVAFVGGSGLNAQAFLYGGIYFALPLLAILGFHEFAHYLAARRRHVEASLPFFIPMPPPFVIFGTFGAFISLREPIPDRKTLMEIGAAGPLAGFALAVPFTFLGLFLSQHAPTLAVNNCGPVFYGVPYGNLLLGGSLIYQAMSLFFPVSANLNPLAIAGWVGLLVTAINLLPAGQLDGGHIFRALLGQRSFLVSLAAVGLLLVAGLFYPGWWIFALLVLFLGIRHPPPLNDISPLGFRRQIIGLVAAAILVTGFVLVPLSTPSGNYALENMAVLPGGTPANRTLANVSFTLNNQDTVSHGFLLATNLTVYVRDSDGNYVVLRGSALANYTSNLSWVLTTPSGGRYYSNGSASFTLPAGSYLVLYGSGHTGNRATYVLTVSNPVPSELYLGLTTSELCRNVQGLPNGGPQTSVVYIPG